MGAALRHILKAVPAAEGRSLFELEITPRIINRLRLLEHRVNTRIPSLMTGEREVLCLVADGMTSKEIGDTLFVPEHAVRNRLTQLVVGPGFSHPTQAAAFSVTHHLCTGAWGLYRVVWAARTYKATAGD